MQCAKCKEALLQRGAVDTVAVADLLGDQNNKAWCKVCTELICSPTDVAMDIYTDYDLCDEDGSPL
jgi:hypothetical protein